MKAIGLLKEQHKRIDTLCKRAIAADACAKAALFCELAELIELHTTLEETHFYPAVRARRTEDILLESLEEHWIMKRVLEQLRAQPASEPAFDARLRVLHELLENHFEDEENELFPKLARVLGKEALDALGQQLEDASTTLAAERDADHARGAPAAAVGGSGARFRASGLQR